MRQLIFLLLFTLVLASCNSSKDKVEEISGIQSDYPKDTTPRVTGIGGIFITSDDPQKTTEWYGKNLGLATDEYGSVFEFRSANNPDEVNYLRWSAFKTGSNYLKPSRKEFMINYRVQNIEGLVRMLRNNGVTILDTIATYDYGKFVHILDPDGNKIELWEPVDSVLTKVGGKTT